MAAAAMVVGGCLFGAGGAQAQTIDYYNFNNGQTSGTALATPVTHATNSGGGSGPTNSAITTNFPTPSTNFEVLSGTTINAQNGDVAGNSLAVLGGTGATTGGTGGNNGDYITLATNTTGYSNIALSFATQRTTTGFNSDQLQYSTDGTTFTNFGAAYTPATAFALQSFDLSSITALNNDPNAAFRIIFNGATGSSGNNRIDNIVLSATPAPPGIVSAGIGFGVTGLGALLRRRKQSQAPKAEAAA